MPLVLFDKGLQMKLLGSNTFSGVVQIIFLAFFFWCAGQFGFFSSINGWMYELSGYLSLSPVTSEKVLIINVSESDDQPEHWQDVMDKVHAYQPAAIVLPYPSVRSPKSHLGVIYRQPLSQQ